MLTRPGAAAEVSSPPPVAAPRDEFSGPAMPFTLVRNTIVEFDYATTSLADLFVEHDAGAAGWVRNRTLNVHRSEGSTSGVFDGPANYRLNNTGPGMASVSVSIVGPGG
jgi:hypothetical protein